MKLKKLLLFVLLISAAPGSLLAQSGKITGQLTDADTGEPLIGATVGIQGTTIGAITDLDGNYLILNVAPGTYVLEARYIGYATFVVQEVIIRTDLTTEQDFVLQPELFEGQEVVVVAERQTVIKDITSSEARVSSEEIAKLPVQELSDVVQLQAGVNVSNDGAIHIRGGRASEVSYVVDGIRVTDDYDGSNGLRVENESIQELQVISGSFNAEHGQALSGIVNIATKSGSNDYEASIRTWGGGYLATNQTEVYDGIGTSFDTYDPLRMYNLTASLSGPIVKDRITFFATVRNFRNQGHLTGRNLYSSHGVYIEDVPLGTDLNEYRTIYNEQFDPNLPWYSLDTLVVGGDDVVRITDNGTRDSSLVDMNEYESLSLQGNLEFKVNSGLKFNIIGSIAEETADEYRGFSNRFVPGGGKTSYRDNYSLNLKTTLTPSANTFITANVANRYNAYKSHAFDDPWDPRYFNYDNLSDPLYGLTAPNGNQTTQDGQFNSYGTNNNRFARSTNSLIIKAEVSSQLNDNHFLKAGFSTQFDEIKFRNIDLAPLTEEGVSLHNDTPDALIPFIQLGIPEVNTPGHQRYTENPIILAGYVQDKIEYENLIINVGLRLDYFDPNSLIPADPEDPDIFNPTKPENQYIDANGNAQQDDNEPDLTVEEREAYWWKDASVKWQLSPRLGVAYPFSETGVIYFSYGYFFQMPSYERLYNNSQIVIREGVGNSSIFGNPDLEPERSIQYELGWKQEIFDGTAIEVAAYYKDTRNYVSSRPQVTGGNTFYGIYYNRDFSRSVGTTFAFNQFVSQRFNFGLDYTFGIVEGSNSDPSAEFFALLDQLGTEIDEDDEALVGLVQPLDWDRTHIINGSMFYTGNTWGANLLAKFSSGTPYTPADFVTGVIIGETESTRDLVNTARLPNRFTLDLNAYKNFDIGGNDLQVFLNIYNLLDTKLVNSVFTDSGSPELPLPADITGLEHPDFYNDPNRYAEPRRIQIGVQFSF